MWSEDIVYNNGGAGVGLWPWDPYHILHYPETESLIRVLEQPAKGTDEMTTWSNTLQRRNITIQLIESKNFVWYFGVPIDKVHGSENQGAEAEFVLHTIALREPWGECVLLITTTLGSSMLKVLVTKGEHSKSPLNSGCHLDTLGAIKHQYFDRGNWFLSSGGGMAVDNQWQQIGICMTFT